MIAFSKSRFDERFTAEKVLIITTMNKKNSSFVQLLKSLGSVDIVREKMFTIPKVWKGIAPYIRRFHLLV